MDQKIQTELQNSYQAYMEKRWPEGDCKGMYDTNAIAEIYRDAYQAGVNSQLPSTTVVYSLELKLAPDCVSGNIIKQVDELVRHYPGVRGFAIIQEFPNADE